MKILLVTNTSDKSADYLCSKIENVFRFDTDQLISSYIIKYTDRCWSITNRKTLETISSDNIVGGYYRRPALPDLKDYFIEEELVNTFRKESYEIYQTIIESINCKWLVNPQNIRITENRILQLQYAEEVGFCIPKYIFSNCEDSITQFISSNTPASIKTLQMGSFSFKSRNYCFYNTLITEDDVSDLSGIPIQVQSYISKKEEYWNSQY